MAFLVLRSQAAIAGAVDHKGLPRRSKRVQLQVWLSRVAQRALELKKKWNTDGDAGAMCVVL